MLSMVGNNIGDDGAGALAEVNGHGRVDAWMPTRVWCDSYCTFRGAETFTAVAVL